MNASHPIPAAPGREANPGEARWLSSSRLCSRLHGGRSPRPMSDPSPRVLRDRGVIFIWVALFLLMIVGFVALGVDIAKLMATRSQLQNAADSAALAGASAIDPATGI